MIKVRPGSTLSSPLSIASFLFLTAIVASSCMGPQLGSGKSSGDKSDLSLSFRVLGVGASASVMTSKSISALILPTASKLTVSLTPLDAGLSTPAPQVLPISSSSSTQVLSASFPDLEWGKYSIVALATDAGGNPQFQQSSTLNLSSSTSSVTLNLLPVITSSSPTYINNGNYFSNIDVGPKTSIGYEIPTIALSGGSYYLVFYMDTSVGLKFYAQDSDGTLIESGDVDSVGYITTDTETSVSYVTITPSSSSVPSYLTLYNPDPSQSATYIEVDLNYPNY
jgi:hypothetical protein